ncbi:MAG: tRNA pseudouridine(38-40) synthase TruA [Candidatus Azobacteroides sp.]|nr:tRNA pseudouridine(38-40) synthase TruA [Candidatus Azobacteroides sp.]
MKRYFIYLSYNGKNYCGWQIQPNGITVQQRLEESLSVLLQEKIEIVGAGRTDSGVHASFMVAHFDSTKEIDSLILCKRLNSILPDDIAIHKIVEALPDAHARFDAISRTYKYFVTTKKDPFRQDFAYRIPYMLNFELMNEAAKTLFDYEDFTSFSKLHTDVKTNNCRILHAEWTQENDSCWVFTIRANRFLRNMVRAIVGTLLEVGRGKITVDDFRKIIEEKNRNVAGTSVPAHALFLTDVSYTLPLNPLKGTLVCKRP